MQNVKAKLEAVAKHLGAQLEQQKGFLKITAAGQEGKAVYVANNGSRVDVSGFSVEIEGVIPHSKPPTKRVPQELNLELEEGAVLKAFAKVLKNGLMNAAVKALPKGGFTKKEEGPAPTAEELDALIAAACSDDEIVETEQE